MKKRKSNEWLIAILATLIVAAITIGGVLFLEKQIEQNRKQASGQTSVPAGTNEVVPVEGSIEDLNPEEPASETTAEPANQKPAETEQPAQEQGSSASEPEQTQQTHQTEPEPAVTERPEGSATPVPTDTPLGENELPDF